MPLKTKQPSALQTTPYWWDEAPPSPSVDAIPHKVDVAIVGSGYAGLSCAIRLAENSVAVAVLEAGQIGVGASTRNHGMVSGGFKLPSDLEASLGAEHAARIRREAKLSFTRMEDSLLPVADSVEYQKTGRFIAAHSASALEGLKVRSEQLARDYGYTTRMLSKDLLREELGTDFYVGGLSVEEAGAVHPGKLHAFMRAKAVAAGALLIEEARVVSIRQTGGSFTLATAKGLLRADRVVVCTNAYTDASAPYLRRRLVPVTAYIAATEELPSALAAELIPKGRMVADTKRALYAIRLSPDKKRILFAGRAAFRDIPEMEAAPILHGFMSGVFPQLKSVRITHCWKGPVAFTFDGLPHIAQANGVDFVGGCQGNGIAMMSYLGDRVARKLLNDPDEVSAYDLENFPSRPLYNGVPWFLPAIGAYYQFRDRLDRTMG